MNFNERIKIHITKMSYDINNPKLYYRLLGFILDTVGSENFTSAMGIHRASFKDDIIDSKWNRFQKFYNRLHNTRPLKQGLYVRDLSSGEGVGEEVHFYALAGGKMANGYSTADNFNPGIGLTYQPDYAHGFCQTFALIWLVRNKAPPFSEKDLDSYGRVALEACYKLSKDISDNGKLIPDNSTASYISNAFQALKFLEAFANFADRYPVPSRWNDMADIVINMQDDLGEITSAENIEIKNLDNFFRMKNARSTIKLVDLIQIIIYNAETHLSNWLDVESGKPDFVFALQEYKKNQ